MKNTPRTICYHCYRPTSSCMCPYITPIKTNTRFIILMHPKEFRKTKNGTGHFTNLSLSNSEIHIGLNFSEDKKINEIINDSNNTCYVLYPSNTSINLTKESFPNENTKIVLFLIDATWPCSRAILTASPNLSALAKVSFTHNKHSGFLFKAQPKDYCLSTMESTLCILELLNKHHLENIPYNKLKSFLKPFEKMVKYQLSCNLQN